MSLPHGPAPPCTMPICLYWEGFDDLSLKTRGPPLSPEQEPEPYCKIYHSKKLLNMTYEKINSI